MGEITTKPELENRNVKSLFPYFRTGIILQVIYCTVAILLFVIPFNVGMELHDLSFDLKQVFWIDFKPFYYAGKYLDTMLTGVEIFYNPFENGFRCFPISAVLYAWCNLVTYEQAGAIYMVMICASNLVTCVYVGKMVKDANGLKWLTIYLATPIQLVLILAGNDSSFAAMFLILGYYLMKNHKPLSAGICFALAILYKPLLLCVVPFLLVIKNRKVLIKDSILQLGGTLLPLVPNVLLYFVNRPIIQAFIDVNFNGPLNPTTNSISVPIAFLLNISPGTVFLVLFLSLTALLFVIYYFRRNEDELDYFKISVLVATATFVGSWTHYYLFYAAFAIISFSFAKNRLLERVWMYLMFINAFQMLIYTFTLNTPMETLYLINLIVGIPYIITIIVEYKLLIKREWLSPDRAAPVSLEAKN